MYAPLSYSLVGHIPSFYLFFLNYLALLLALALKAPKNRFIPQLDGFKFPTIVISGKSEVVIRAGIKIRSTRKLKYSQCIRTCIEKVAKHVSTIVQFRENFKRLQHQTLCLSQKSILKRKGEISLLISKMLECTSIVSALISNK